MINSVIKEDKGCFSAVFTAVNRCFQIWFIHDKIALEGWNLLEQIGIFLLDCLDVWVCLGLTYFLLSLLF